MHYYLEAGIYMYVYYNKVYHAISEYDMYVNWVPYEVGRWKYLCNMTVYYNMTICNQMVNCGSITARYTKVPIYHFVILFSAVILLSMDLRKVTLRHSSNYYVLDFEKHLT